MAVIGDAVEAFTYYHITMAIAAVMVVATDSVFLYVSGAATCNCSAIATVVISCSNGSCVGMRAQHQCSFSKGKINLYY